LANRMRWTRERDAHLPTPPAPCAEQEVTCGSVVLPKVVVGSNQETRETRASIHSLRLIALKTIVACTQNRFDFAILLRDVFVLERGPMCDCSNCKLLTNPLICEGLCLRCYRSVMCVSVRSLRGWFILFF
jgi:hypothetical protein